MAKRNTNRGIQPNSNGTYTAVIRSKDYGYIARTFNTKTDAREWREETFSDLRRGRKVILNGELMSPKQAQSGGKDLNGALDRYSKEADFKLRDGHVKFWRKKLGKKLLADITRMDIINALDSLDVSGPTKNRYQACISKILQVSITRFGWIETNVARQIEKRKENQRDRIFSQDEHDAILDACDQVDSRMKVIYLIARFTGARQGEILSLTYNSIDQDGNAVLEKTKNGEKRVIAIRGEALDALKDFTKVRPLDGTELIFGAFDASHTFKKVLEIAGIKNARFHDVRHTFATQLAGVGGINAPVLQKVLGHKSAAMTNRYTHLMDDAVISAVEKMVEQS